MSLRTLVLCRLMGWGEACEGIKFRFNLMRVEFDRVHVHIQSLRLGQGQACLGVSSIFWVILDINGNGLMVRQAAGEIRRSG